MIKITGFKIGYKCPMCQYIRPQENIKNHSIQWFSENINTSSIKCPTCNAITHFDEWEMVMYPCVKE